MPLFFFLSGILFKPVLFKNFAGWSLYISFMMFLTYFIYGIAIFAVFNIQHLEMLPDHLYNLLYGGSRLQGPYGVFWFITVLLLTQLLLGIISNFYKWIQILVVAALFVAGHSEIIISFDWLWNANVVLIAVFFYFLGHYSWMIVSKYLDTYILSY